jgi:hypothetical protein
MKRFWLPLLALLVSGRPGWAFEQLWLPPRKEVFPLLLADPRSAQFSLQIYRVGNQTRSADSLGHQIPLWRLETDRGGILQWGLEAAGFLRLTLSTVGQNAALTDTDWFFGFPIEYRQGAWAFRLWSFHTSSHLGDNYLIAHNITPITYSRETAEALISYSFSQLTIYGGGSQAIHAIPIVDTWAAHAGFQAWSKPLDAKGILKLYAAVDEQPKAQVDWQVQTNVETGFSIKPERSDKTIRIYLNYSAGPSPTGQFFQTTRSYWAGGLAFDF